MRYPGIEIGRVAGLLGVVVIHAATVFGPRQDLAFLASELSRFSVPLFFMASGFFWKAERIADPFAAIRTLIIRALLPFAAFVIFYAVADRWSVFYPRSYFGSARSYLLFPVSGGVGYHLWFLPALFIGSAVVLTAIRYLGLRRAFALSALAYLTGCLLFYLSHMADRQIEVIFYRNGFFFAPLFLVAGYGCRYFDWHHRLPAFIALLLVVAGAAAQVSEGYVFAYPHGHDMSLATVPFAFGVFLLCARATCDPAFVANWGRDVFYGYLIHLLVLKAIWHRFPYTGTTAAIIIILSTLLLSLLLARYYRLARSGFMTPPFGMPPSTPT